MPVATFVLGYGLGESGRSWFSAVCAATIPDGRSTLFPTDPRAELDSLGPDREAARAGSPVLPQAPPAGRQRAPTEDLAGNLTKKARRSERAASTEPIDPTAVAASAQETASTPSASIRSARGSSRSADEGAGREAIEDPDEDEGGAGVRNSVAASDGDEAYDWVADLSVRAPGRAHFSILLLADHL